MTKIRYKEKEKERREQDIIETAGRLLLERGYTSLNMDELADVVGISKTTLYQHFRSKEDLVARLIQQNMAHFDEYFDKMQAETPLKRLQGMMRWMIANRFQHASILSLTDREALKTIVHNNPALIEHRKRGQIKVHALIEAAKAAGEIDPDLPTPIVANALISLQMAIIGHHFETGIAEKDLDKSIEAIIRIFVSGVSARS